MLLAVSGILTPRVCDLGSSVWRLVKANAGAMAESKPLVIRDDAGEVIGGHLADFHKALLAEGTIRRRILREQFIEKVPVFQGCQRHGLKGPPES